MDGSPLLPRPKGIKKVHFREQRAGIRSSIVLEGGVRVEAGAPHNQPTFKVDTKHEALKDEYKK